MKGLPCPACHSDYGNAVKDSRIIKSTVRRRRTCLKCGHKWSTVEINDTVFQSLIRGDSADHRNSVIKRVVTELMELIK